MPSPLQNIYAHYAAQDFRAALDLFDNLEVEPDPADERLMATVAQCHFKTGDKHQAAQLFLRAALAGTPPKLQFASLAFELSRMQEDNWTALKAAEVILQIVPDHATAAQFRRHHLFGFLELDELKAANDAALAGIRAGNKLALSCELPHNHIMWMGDERLNAKIADSRFPLYSEHDRLQRRNRPHLFGDRIRIGYLSGDVSSAHATMILLRGVLEQHDREKFDIRIYCNTPGDLIARDDGLRKHIGTIVDIKGMSDEEATARMRADGIDILVDLKGHTRDTRIGVVNAGPAPIQVAWLGFPGSAVGIDCDYVIGDRIVTPDESRPFYHEKFCRLPDCYQPNDDHHRPLPQPALRAGLGLPEDKFVFASFNNVRKVSPEVASAWARILTAAGDSVLWMTCNDEHARGHFLAWMKRRGVEEDQIIFARTVGREPHAARLQAADLCLDTFPCNGHTTTSDCLWSGLPVLTVRGSNFASRVSESLLRTIGLPELVAATVDDYVAKAVSLSRNRGELDGLRTRLIGNRATTPLFDTERFTRHLERAYEMMVERAKADLPPDHFDVPALDATAAAEHSLTTA